MRANTVLACLGAASLAATEPIPAMAPGRPPFLTFPGIARRDNGKIDDLCLADVKAMHAFTFRDAQAVMQQWVDHGDRPVRLGQGDCDQREVGKCIGWICRDYSSSRPPVDIKNSFVVGRLSELSD